MKLPKYVGLNRRLYKWKISGGGQAMTKKQFKHKYQYLQDKVEEWRREGADDDTVTRRLIICVTTNAGTEYASTYTEDQLQQIFDLRRWKEGDDETQTAWPPDDSMGLVLCRSGTGSIIPDRDSGSVNQKKKGKTSENNTKNNCINDDGRGVIDWMYRSRPGIK